MPGEIRDGWGHVDYSIPKLALGPGEYSLTVAAHDHDGTAVLDKRERVVTFRVATDEAVFGLVDLMGTWSGMIPREEDQA